MKQIQAIEREEDPSINNLSGQGKLPQKPAIKHGAKVALLTPYSGHNLGDAAIQDSAISQLRLRMPDVAISGITLNSENFISRHESAAFPILANGRPYYDMFHGEVGGGDKGGRSGGLGRTGMGKILQRRFPGLWKSLKMLRRWVALPKIFAREGIHWFKGYGFIRNHDILIVSGGGQLDEEWGGPWGHPYSLLKWAVLSRVAGVPMAFASVGVCKVRSRLGRFFISKALGMAKYRSYRDENSKRLSVAMLGEVCQDPVIPDLAFSLQIPNSSSFEGVRVKADGRFVVAISLIAFGKGDKKWSCEHSEVYQRYLREISQVIDQLFKQGYYVVLVWSDLGDKKNATPDLLECLDDNSRLAMCEQLHISGITRWQDLVATLLECDLLIASRLHSTILGLVTETPVIAISFDPKVDWVMEDLGLTEFLLQISDFPSEDVIRAVGRIRERQDRVVTAISLYKKGVSIELAKQYDKICELVSEQRS